MIVLPTDGDVSTGVIARNSKVNYIIFCNPKEWCQLRNPYVILNRSVN